MDYYARENKYLMKFSVIGHQVEGQILNIQGEETTIKCFIDVRFDCQYQKDLSVIKTLKSIVIVDVVGCSDSTKLCNKGYGSLVVANTCEFIKYYFSAEISNRNDVTVIGEISNQGDITQDSKVRRKHFWKKMDMTLADEHADEPRFSGTLINSSRNRYAFKNLMFHPSKAKAMLWNTHDQIALRKLIAIPNLGSNHQRFKLYNNRLKAHEEKFCSMVHRILSWLTSFIFCFFLISKLDSSFAGSVLICVVIYIIMIIEIVSKYSYFLSKRILKKHLDFKDRMQGKLTAKLDSKKEEIQCITKGHLYLLARIKLGIDNEEFNNLDVFGLLYSDQVEDVMSMLTSDVFSNTKEY
ncbi:hypothetical protein [Moritella viscosa]|uniref:Uncharacterized protein n=1 Tax=Moritella viscosa TaxID=80854 RepID=A0A1L0APG1_9GAMM|nr:hypothetical protein [Moritella viscosa]SGZ19232.1 Putative uncharacterized protein [Moritella viscosa]